MALCVTRKAVSVLDVTVADLRGDMGMLAELLGVEAVIELCSLFGGDNLYIPLGEEKTEDMEELKLILGDLEYQKLKQRCGGAVIYFPKTETLLKEYITKQVRKAYDGTNRRRLMREYHLTKNTFYRIIQGDQEKNSRIFFDDHQLTLFDYLTNGFK